MSEMALVSHKKRVFYAIIVEPCGEETIIRPIIWKSWMNQEVNEGFKSKNRLKEFKIHEITF